MTKGGRGQPRGRHAASGPPRHGPRWATLGAVLGLAAIGPALVWVLNRGGGQTGQTAWARLGTSDVHSLAFVGDDANHVLFGHHAGIAESRDGGRTWHSLPVSQDAMGLRPADDGSIVIAGHEVFSASRDAGVTWQPIPADLPSLDIHGFARDPGDPARMWVALATGGFWKSTDFGIHWTRVRDDGLYSPLAVRTGGTARLLAVDATGLVASDDGGRTWRPLTTPPTYPMTALAATPDGSVLYAGTLDGMYRSDDAGGTWTATADKGSAFAIATSPDGAVVAVVSQETEFFRSSDRGATWPGPD